MAFTLITEDILKEKDGFIRHMEETGSYSYPESEEYSAEELNEGKKGMMFSLLIARTKGGERKLLRGFSGLSKGRCLVPGFVPPCYSTNDFEAITKEYDLKIKKLSEQIDSGVDSLRNERKNLTHEALERLNALYSFTDINGNRFPLSDIGSNLPTGTGDCAGIKVLNYALRKGWSIEGFVEFYYGKETESRKSGEIYEPCRERCERLIARMLGLRFLHIEDDFAIVDKEAGMLSVPGRGEDKYDSVSTRFHKIFPDSPEQCFVHRLDMDTSGLLILARNRESHRTLSMEFEARKVHKEYEALLEGRITEKEGVIELPLRLDVDNRPHQIVDPVQGKYAKTVYKVLGYTSVNGNLCTRVRFFPETGRTHQLRVHSASGLKHPIYGDRLYGHREPGERLMLHAAKITFVHPRTGETVTYSSEVPF